MHPDTFMECETRKLTDGSFLMGVGGRAGAPVNSAARRLWDLPVVLSRAVDPKKSLVLAVGAVQLFTDGVAAVEVNPYTGWKRNTVDFRAEMRVQVGRAPRSRTASSW